MRVTDEQGEGGALFGWLVNYRRLVARYTAGVDDFVGFICPACVLILLPQFF